MCAGGTLDPTYQTQKLRGFVRIDLYAKANMMNITTSHQATKIVAYLGVRDGDKVINEEETVRIVLKNYRRKKNKESSSDLRKHARTHVHVRTALSKNRIDRCTKERKRKMLQSCRISSDRPAAVWTCLSVKVLALSHILYGVTRWSYDKHLLNYTIQYYVM